MSVPAVSAPGAVVPVGAPIVGLEDYNPATDQVTPRLTIDHDDGTFKNSLTNEHYPATGGKYLDVIMLGLVKQRSMWPPTYDGSEDPPLCKSLDFANGNPGVNFPWDKSGFNPDEYADGRPLPCSSCPLREWGSHPTADTPWCSEQHTYVIMLPGGDASETVWMPALFSVQRTGIKPSRTYINSFQQARTPMFIVTTKMALVLNKRGKNEYYVPEFTRGDPTSESEWHYYTQTYLTIRDIITSPRAIEADDSAPSSVSPATTPAAAASPASPPASAAAAGAPSAPKDDEIPF